MRFEKPPVFNPTKVELEPIAIPQRFDLNEDPEMQQGLRDALEGSKELIEGEKYSSGRLPNLELRYRKSLLEILLREGTVDVKIAKQLLESEHVAVKESAYQKALERVYRLNGSIGSTSNEKAGEASKDEDEEDDWQS